MILLIVPLALTVAIMAFVATVSAFNGNQILFIVTTVGAIGALVALIGACWAQWREIVHIKATKALIVCNEAANVSITMI
jgi:hypothetical protein